MAEISDLEKDFDYTIELDVGEEYVHLYYANVIDFESPAFVRFDPLYEVSKDVERKIDNLTVMIPYDKVLRIIKRKPE